jgi:hypothetical protein
MKFLKIILLLLIVVTNTSFINSPNPTNTEVIREPYTTVVYIPWKKSGSGYWTQTRGYNRYNDFDMMISRSTTQINGYYYFDVWLYSQSYYWVNNSPNYVSTNITNVSVIVNNQTIIYYTNPIGITFKGEYSPKHLRFKTISPTPSVWLKWGNMRGM